MPRRAMPPLSHLVALLSMCGAAGFALPAAPSVAIPRIASRCPAPRAASAWDALTTAQKDALLAAERAYPVGAEDAKIQLTRAGAAEWDVVRSEFPGLAGLGDTDLSAAYTAYLDQPISPLDVLLKTPVGPTVLINVLLLASGVSYCDAPWAAQTKACAELAARSL